MTGRTNAGGGVQLPALTNPAAAGNIQSGYQAINGEGEVVTGTASVRESVVVTVINNSNNALEVSYCRRSSYKPNSLLLAHTTETYNALTRSLFVVKPRSESESIQVESSQQYSIFLSYDNVFGALVYDTALTLTVT